MMNAWPKSRQSPASLEFEVLHQPDDALHRRQPVRESPRGRASTPGVSATRVAISSTLRFAASRWLSFGGGDCASGWPMCTTRCSYGTVAAICSAARVSFTVQARAPGVRDGVGQRGAPDAVDVALDDRGVHGVQRQPGRRQPLAERLDGARVVVVEVRLRREQLDAGEPVGLDGLQVFEREPFVVEEVRRESKEHGEVPGASGVREPSIVVHRTSSRCLPSSSRRRPKRGYRVMLSRTYLMVRGMYWM